MASPPATSPPSPDATPSSPPSTSPPAPQSPPPSDSTPPPSMSPPPPGASPPPPPSPPASSTPGGQAAPPTKSSGSQPPPSPPPQARGGSSSPVSQESPPAPRRSGGSASGGSKGGSGDGGDRGSASSSGSSATGAMVAGVVIAVVVFAVLLLASACCCFAKKRKKKRPPPMSHIPYYTDEKGHVYYANGGAPPKWQQHSGSPGLAGLEHNLPPPPGWHHHHAGHPLSTPLGSNAAPLSGEMGATTTGPYSGPHGPPLPPPSPNVALGFTKSAFTYEELAAATGGFAAANMLGQGGFGYVYKGVLAGSGKEVAVKQLKTGSGQGEREFQAEVEIISRVHHRHLVSLVGYCIAGSQRLLVYEFVPNQTLEHHLHGKGMPVMEWSRRHKIALGSAKGLAYLHEDCHPRIIHRDIKTANILLDNNFEAMVADFGLAKLTTDTNTHVSTRVMGTFGYLAPEYASSGKLTEKSDVFSFGVMLLELITGRRPIDTSNYMEDSLVDWARPLLAGTLSGEASFEELVDPRLEKNYSPVELERMAASAAACIRHSARRRPKMSQIVRALEGDVSLEALNEGVKPGQSMLFSSGGSDANNITRLRQLAFDSGDYSDDYSITTSEHSGDSEATQRHK